MTPRCSSPASNHGDGRGCEDENCPRHGGDKDEPVCNCYPGGFSPETYEGPQHHCPVHGHGTDLPVSECPQCQADRLPRLIPSWVFTVPTEDPAEPRYMETLDDLERGGH